MRRPHPAPWLVLVLALVAIGCRDSRTGRSRGGTTPPAQPVIPALTDGSDAAGITLVALNRPDAAGYGHGAALADIDADGDLDIFFAQDAGPCALYRNDGDLVFTDIAVAAGVDLGPEAHAKGVAFLDFDRDGDPDLLVGRAGDGNRLFRNRGDGTFEDVSDASGIGTGAPFTMSFALADFDRDGWTDVYESNFTPTDYSDPLALVTTPAPNRLWKNNGDGTFTDVAPALGVDDPLASWAAHWVDLDRDGVLDLLVVNDTFFYPDEDVRDRAFIGSGAPGFAFTDRAATYGLDASHNGMGIAVGDLDGDGTFDLYVTDFGANELHFTGTPPPWPDQAAAFGVDLPLNRIDRPLIGWGAAIQDFDRDGRMDLLVMNGLLSSIDPGPFATTDQDPALFLARDDEAGGLRLEDRTADSGLLAVRTLGARAAIPADLDGDGDLDLVISTRIGRACLVRNDSPTRGAWYGVRLRGTASEIDGLGAELELRTSDGVVVRDLVTGGGQTHSMLPRERLFTPGPRARGDAMLTVTWPTGVAQEVVLRPNRRTVVVEP